MKNKNLETAVFDLVGAIKQICLGNITYVVIDEAVSALIYSWNDCTAETDEDMIDSFEELRNWNKIKDEIIYQ